MSKQTLNPGLKNNDKTGDTLRAGALKIKSNFDEIYTALAIDGQNISGGNILKSGSWNDLRDKPAFKPISTSASFYDLEDRPEIVTAIAAPSTLVGTDGQGTGNIAFDGNNLYVATMDYDGQNQIWKYIPWGGNGTSQGYNYVHNQDPTSIGGFSLDNESPALATVAYIATSDISGNDIHPFYQYIFENNLSANLEIISRTNPENRALFKVTGSTEKFANGVEYYELNLQHIMHADSMTIGTGVWDLHFDFTGDSKIVVDADGTVRLGNASGAIYANQTTGVISIADYLGPDGAPAMPSTAIHIGGSNALVISRGNGSNNPSWTFKDNGSLQFPDMSVQTGASISLSSLKTLVADSADFADFKNRIAAL